MDRERQGRSQPLTFYAQLPFPSAATFNASYAGAGGRLTKNPGAEAWMSDVEILMRRAGATGLLAEQDYFTAIYWVLWTCDMDVDAPTKSLNDAICTSLFGVAHDKRGRTIYRDDWQGASLSTKMWVAHRAEQRLEVFVRLTPAQDKAAFNDSSSRMRAALLAALGLEEPTTKVKVAWEKLTPNRWQKTVVKPRVAIKAAVRRA